jgi:LmbE family N-acetylglucosaminyl deacetylase
MEPIADNEVKRVLVVNAHPDDSDFGASGTIAQWVKKGIEVAYVFCTNGDQGGEESGFTKEEMPAIRQREQRAAGAAIGVTDITFLILSDKFEFLSQIALCAKAQNVIGSALVQATQIT